MGGQIGGSNLPGRKNIFLEGGSIERPLPFREASFASRKVLSPNLYTGSITVTTA
jgi:hypothetical protein